MKSPTARRGGAAGFAGWRFPATGGTASAPCKARLCRSADNGCRRHEGRRIACRKGLLQRDVYKLIEV
jgi:hypothetical protein